MTFEMVMAAMALAAKADKYNHPDYDAIEEKYRQEELEWARYKKELKDKYPKEMNFDWFVLRCTIFVPFYSKKIECFIADQGIWVYNFFYKDGEKVYDFISPWGAEYEYVEEYCPSPHLFNDHTGELNKSIEEMLGWVISCSIYRREGNEKKALECETKVNMLLRSRNIKYDSKFLSFTNIKDKTGVGLYSIASEGVQLREG